ncbi:AraC family transcriptional regulator [Treponema phagedenis]|uniref:AraC family transcriptional regulator n=4 Tax=Treponema phagedenis TaxID=162 RepID=A0A0B7GVN3_TREPH|nr:AraC family transcriptional regulator [Treponema phagedenis]NVP24060.1 AraC family transcriptional regulator [Treponema phagedenis]QEJ99371.1 AraC family transcriptional regulator [Treponema phagedenis]QEJ99980.1 AraC family transcriptional regulator [Treponema phagedenis]QEK04942.1 AraC family transcriptional regulator [Treponema phagedenis]QEK07439.1 AraC family transcriptional regulator [Treponema phagedenis]
MNILENQGREISAKRFGFYKEFDSVNRSVRMKEKSGLQFYYSGYEKCGSGHFFGPAIRAHYLVHIVISGKGSYQVKGSVIPVEKNQAFLIRPKEISFYAADTKDPWEYIWFSFDGEESDILIDSFFSDESRYIVSAEDPIRLEQFLQTALPYFQQQSLSQMELQGWCYLFFSCFKKQPTKASQDFKDNYFSKALNYIRYNYMRDINVNQISAEIGIDRTYLYKIIKEFTGVSPKTYITILRIEAAKNMLQYSNYSITDIAALCGFHDQSSFCKIFRRHETQTPSEYRQTFIQ